ncbi:MAG: hypothetical protein AAGD86_02270 [Pseudomonadota bacterium]
MPSSHIDIFELLVPEADWAAPDLVLFEDDDALRLSLAGAIAYSGVGSIGGLVLGFRVLQFAVEVAAGPVPVQRSALSVQTALAGRGVRDAFEFTCRAVRDYRFCCDRSLHHPAARPGMRGAMLFNVKVHDQSLVLIPADGLPSASYFDADSQADGSPEATQRWREEKIGFANALLKLAPAQCIRML